MDIIGLDDLSNPEGIFRHIDWKPDLVDVGQVYKTLELPQVKFRSIVFLLSSGGLAKSSKPIPFEYSCQVTWGVNKAMLSPRKQSK